MGVIQSALTIASSIGKIAGTLSGAIGNYVDFGDKGSISPNLGELIFLNRDGQTWAFNQSTKNRWGISIPLDPTLSPTSQASDVILAPTTKLPISPLFRDASKLDVDSLTIFKVDEPGNNSGLIEEDKDSTIHASTTATAPPNQEISVGPYFTAKLSPQNMTLLISAASGTGVLVTALVLLNVRGAGNTLARIIRASSQKQVESSSVDPAEPIIVDLPSGLDVSGGLTFIDIIATVKGLGPGIYDRIPQLPKPQALTSDDYDFLAKINSGR